MEPDPNAPDSEVFCLLCHGEILISERRIPARVDGVTGYRHDFCPTPR